MHPLTATWWRLFINRTDGTLRASRDGWHFDSTVLEQAEVSRALSGKQSLGVYAASETGLSRWVCLDADTDEGGQALLGLAQNLDPRSTLFELSRRGAHLWWFCPPTPWRRAQGVGLALAQQAGITCEVFPKSQGRTGVRLPLTPHPGTREIYPVLDPNTGELKAVSALRRVRPETLPQLAAPEILNPRRREPVDGGNQFGDLVREIEQVTRVRVYGPERAVGHCPFHDDRHPSLSVLGGFWRCWAGCGEGGIGAFRALAHKKGV